MKETAGYTKAGYAEAGKKAGENHGRLKIVSLTSW
jgi:hypothetical protein